MSTAELLAPSDIALGWHYGMPMEDYLALPAMSASGLVDIRVSPAHLFYKQRNPKVETPLMALGTALHCALLEPDLFNGRYITLGQCEAIKSSDGQRCTNPGSVYRDGQSFCGLKGHDPAKGQPMVEGIRVLPQSAMDAVEGMKRAVLKHPDASRYLSRRGRSEVVGVWRDLGTGVLCKIRLDRELDHAAHIHTDFKTTGDASVEGFTRQAGRLHYVLKSAWYRRGLAALGRNVTSSVLIAVESEAKVDYGNGPEHAVQAFVLDEKQIRAFSGEIDQALATYAECLSTGLYHAYEPGLRNLELKPWDLPESLRKADDFDSDTWEDFNDPN